MKESMRFVTRLGSDTASLTATSFASVTGLSAALPAAAKYRFTVYAKFTMAGTTPTITFGVNGPTANHVMYTLNAQTGAAAQPSIKTAGAYNGNTGMSGTATTATVFGLTMDGYVDVSASGTLQITYQVAGTSAAVVVKAGSVIIVERIDE